VSFPLAQLFGIAEIPRAAGCFFVLDQRVLSDKRDLKSEK
jgi:hypothetical protein